MKTNAFLSWKCSCVSSLCVFFLPRLLLPRSFWKTPWLKTHNLFWVALVLLFQCYNSPWCNKEYCTHWGSRNSLTTPTIDHCWLVTPLSHLNITLPKSECKRNHLAPSYCLKGESLQQWHHLSGPPTVAIFSATPGWIVDYMVDYISCYSSRWIQQIIWKESQPNMALANINELFSCMTESAVYYYTTFNFQTCEILYTP